MCGQASWLFLTAVRTRDFRMALTLVVGVTDGLRSPGW